MTKVTNEAKKEKVNDAIEEVIAEAKKEGFQIELDDNFENQEQIKNPVIKLKRAARVGDSARAIEAAKLYYNTDDPNQLAIQVALLSNLCSFNGKDWNIKEVDEGCTSSFLQSAIVIYMKYLK